MTPAQLTKFAAWVEQWWKNFDKMDVGTAYKVSDCAKNPELFVQVGKDYIDHSANGQCFVFSDDYKYFKRFTESI